MQITIKLIFFLVIIIFPQFIFGQIKGYAWSLTDTSEKLSPIYTSSIFDDYSYTNEIKKGQIIIYFPSDSSIKFNRPKNVIVENLIYAENLTPKSCINNLTNGVFIILDNYGSKPLLEIIFEVKRGKLNGAYYEYNTEQRTNELILSCEYVNNIREGSSFIYSNKNGQKYFNEWSLWKEGEKIQSISFYPNGKKYIEVNLVQGFSKIWSQNGSLLSCTSLSKKGLVKEFRRYDSLGNLIFHSKIKKNGNELVIFETIIINNEKDSLNNLKIKSEKVNIFTSSNEHYRNGKLKYFDFTYNGKVVKKIKLNRKGKETVLEFNQKLYNIVESEYYRAFKKAKGIKDTKD